VDGFEGADGCEVAGLAKPGGGARVSGASCRVGGTGTGSDGGAERTFGDKGASRGCSSKCCVRASVSVSTVGLGMFTQSSEGASFDIGWSVPGVGSSSNVGASTVVGSSRSVSATIETVSRFCCGDVISGAGGAVALGAGGLDCGLEGQKISPWLLEGRGEHTL
jgi:hypothetical protein